MASSTATAGLSLPPALSRSQQGRRRPPLLRALGRAEPPALISVDGLEYEHEQTFKHDSWAATALYRHADGRQIVCKFNRVQPICGIPMRWLGRWLATRELSMLRTLADEPLVPAPCGEVRVAGRPAPHGVAHSFVPGRPLVRHMPLSPDFLRTLEALLHRVHRRGIAYVDLHKRENILVGDDGRPYLIDFQISLRLSRRGLTGAVLRMLQRCDTYHLGKHKRRFQLDQGMRSVSSRDLDRPWAIRLHRGVAVPLRTSRRALLVWLGVRTTGGRAHTESEPEVGALQWTGP